MSETPPAPTPTDAFVFLLTLLLCVSLAVCILFQAEWSLWARGVLGVGGFWSNRVNLALARKMQASWQGRL